MHDGRDEEAAGETCNAQSTGEHEAALAHSDGNLKPGGESGYGGVRNAQSDDSA